MVVVSYTVCPVGFVLISHVCPRSEEPVDGKGYCTVPRVKVTLKKIQIQQESLDGGAGCH